MLLHGQWSLRDSCLLLLLQLLGGSAARNGNNMKVFPGGTTKEEISIKMNAKTDSPQLVADNFDVETLYCLRQSNL